MSHSTARLGGLWAVAKPTPVLILAADPWLGIVTRERLITKQTWFKL